ncbi:semaphorin-6D-like isoform X2 [Solea senegalensis]|uniref:Semaphorin-6D-like isoform X2 n=1 Tax=Solea senegalensis TaxID=28829 RepID=A0AAV6R774_SOLSE|nr:semaphorin-6D-like isoform X2 [Solea senegalensis]
MKKMVFVDWLLPRQQWPPLMLLLVFTVHFLSEALTTPFPKDLEPISIVSSQYSYHFSGFHGLHDNDTQRLGLDFQTMMRINHVLFIAARDHVFAVNLTTTAAALDNVIVPQLTMTWKSEDVSKCKVRGKNSDECYNYIKVLVPRNDETLFTCGTNAFNPTCRDYQMTSLEQLGDDLIGQARCPFESHQSNIGLFTGGDFYSATTTDFLASDAVFYRSLGDNHPVLRTFKYDSKWLREPHFLHAIDYGSFVYFFFREIAVEFTVLGKVVFSRVARVCKNDSGGSPRVLERYWTSYLKARLNCSVPGDSFFYFDVLQSVTNVLQVNGRPALAGVFTTQDNSIPGSAVCFFFMDDIENIFSGTFKEQQTSDSSWTPVPDQRVPQPRPGVCAGDGAAADYMSSVHFPDETLTFIKSHPLMDKAVPSVNERPSFMRTSSRSKLTQIVVDVSAGPFKDRMVMFLGSDDGRVLKVLVSTYLNNSIGTKLLEDIDVYNPSKCNVQGQEDRVVLGLELDKDHHALFVAFSSCVLRVPLSRCSHHGGCKQSCLTSRDPYCVWLRSGCCADITQGLKSGFEQDIEDEQLFDLDGCYADILATSRSDSTYDMDQRATANVHYTFLLACILVAFFLGMVVSGFLVSCYCSRGAAQRAAALGKEPEASLPRGLSLRSLAKLSGLLEGTPKVKVGVSTPRLYSSFMSNSQASSTPHTPPCHDLLLGGAHLRLSQVDGQLSVLTLSECSPDSTPYSTPDSSSELPVNNQKDYSVRDNSVRDHSVRDNSIRDNSVGDNSVRDNSVRDHSVRDNSIRDNSVGDNSRDNSVGDNNSFKDYSVRDYSVRDYSVRDYSVGDHSVGDQSVRDYSVRDNSFKDNSVRDNSVSLLHVLEEKKTLKNEQAVAGRAGGRIGGGAISHHHCAQTANDVSALDELLKHIHEVSASGSGGIKVLTTSSCAGQYHHHQSARHYSSSLLPAVRLPKCLDPPPQNSTSSTPLLIPEKPRGSFVMRHHSFNLQGVPNTNTNNGPSGANRGAKANNSGVSLTRQHSYSEGPRVLLSTLSIKPQIPPTSVLLTKTEASPAQATETSNH